MVLCSVLLSMSFVNDRNYIIWGFAVVARLVETLRNKPEGRGFDSRWGNWDFSLT
jgi:hypothetical protein